ncbi:MULTISPECIES: (2Fe-2S) ferredoxin domain-containing protein [unclassified Sphingomonas]|uniref:(2Fe-2S) ferredoxin domain-containing protein n=1 Tax=unclassified Sphingomonas TaxID=196159 RepID=UPI002AB2B7DA|nr:(2Fe-2S) ferredoxin domain-containing protein [Sphingomonas sp. IC4-52]
MKQARAHWRGAVLVCAKCSKKVDGGFGPKGRDRLAKALRREPGFGKGRKADIGVVEVKCLGLCPKNAVTVVDTRRPHEWLVVPAASDVADLATRFS